MIKTKDYFTAEEALAYTLEIAVRHSLQSSGMKVNETNVANTLIRLSEIFPQRLRDMTDTQLEAQRYYSQGVVKLFKGLDIT